MIEEELNKISDEKLPAKNLKYALLALGYLVLAGVGFYLAIDSLGTRTGRGFISVMVWLCYLATIVAGIYAFLACRNSLRSLKTNKSGRNYIALAIGGLVLILICYDILQRL